MEISSNINNPSHRVTVYRLSDDGSEIEQASENMPHIKVEYLEGSKDVGLYLVDEEDNEKLLLHRIVSNDIYRRESDNDIVWREPRIDSELSLRFEDKIECNFIWDNICKARRNIKFNALVKNMLSESGDDIQYCEFTEILQNLVDSELNSTVEIFYERDLVQLIDVIISACPTNSNSQVKPEALLRICELLHFCVLDHPNAVIKSNFLVNNVIEKVLLLTRRREQYLAVAALKFLKSLVWLKDENVEDHIVKNDLFKPVVSEFVENGSKYNLLHSAVLDLFEFIRKENLKTLYKYLVESYWKKLVQFDHLPSIFMVKVKYQQSFENQRDERIPEKEKEDYFNEDSIFGEDYINEDEEDSAAESMLETNASASNSSKSFITAARLVDYDDDDDDDDDDDHHDVNWKHRKKKTRLA